MSKGSSTNERESKENGIWRLVWLLTAPIMVRSTWSKKEMVEQIMINNSWRKKGAKRRSCSMASCRTAESWTREQQETNLGVPKLSWMARTGGRRWADGSYFRADTSLFNPFWAANLHTKANCKNGSPSKWPKSTILEAKTESSKNHHKFGKCKHLGLKSSRQA